jgi:hypothetical protein
MMTGPRQDLTDNCALTSNLTGHPPQQIHHMPDMVAPRADLVVGVIIVIPPWRAVCSHAMEIPALFGNLWVIEHPSHLLVAPFGMHSPPT